MYITKDPEIARIVESAGVERIFIDMEYIGKDARQRGMDTVQSHHTVDDVRKMKEIITTSEVMVRVNPIHEATSAYSSSKEEIDAVIKAGADVVMLPYFKSVEEVQTFVELVDGRVSTILLLETPEAVEIVDQIIELPGVNEIFIGLNDLSLGYKKKFMFEILADGTVERLCFKFKQKGIPYGFGGIASMNGGKLPGRYVVKEHYRLGSTCVILSRSFCASDTIHGKDEFRTIFEKQIRELRTLEAECEEHRRIRGYFTENKKLVINKVRIICEDTKENRQ